MKHFYHHIEAPFKRRDFTSLPEDMSDTEKKALCKFVDTTKLREPYLEEIYDNMMFEAKEKVDGSNRFFYWDGNRVEVFGKSEKTEFSKTELELYDLEELERRFEDKFGREVEVQVFFELVGKHGNGMIYNTDKNEHLMLVFDVCVNGTWLQWLDVEDVAIYLGLNAVPYNGHMTIKEAVQKVRQGMVSSVPGLFKAGREGVEAEGLVICSANRFRDYKGNRLIYKIKARDYDSN